MIKLDSFQGYKDGLTYTNQCDTPHNRRKNKNHMIISIDTEKQWIKFNIYS